MKIPPKKKVVLPKSAPTYTYHVDRDGVTQGVLATYLECRERARLSVLEGLSSAAPSMPLVLGSIGHEFLDWWHQPGKKHLDRYAQEGAINAAYDKIVGTIPPKSLTTGFKDELTEDFVVIKQLLYAYAVKYKVIDRAVDWCGAEDEFCFHVDGTPVRGKIDGAFRSGKSKSVRLLESKFKARWSEDAMTDWLPLDLQTGMYITAIAYDEKLRDRLKLKKGEVVRSFRYDVSRKPQLRRRKDERLPDFVQRVEEDLRVRPDHYFHRWDVELTDADLKRHEQRILRLVREFRVWAYHHHEAKRNNLDGPEVIWTSAACEGRFSTCPYLGICARGDKGAMKVRDRPFMELTPVN